MDYFVGIDLGGTNLRAAVVHTGQGTVLAQRQCATRAAEGQQAVIERMLRLTSEMISESGVSGLGGIGIGVPGTPDMERGWVRFLTNLPGQWRDVPLGPIFSAQTGLPVALINDVRAMTLGEWIFGAGQGASTVAVFALGTGIGGGLVINGQLHLGIAGTAGELGHQVVVKDGLPCGCGGRGCLEMYASGPAIAEAGEKAVAGGHATLIADLAQSDLNQITAEMVVQAAQSGDPMALSILQRAGEYLGLAVANVVAVISPERVIFGGGVAAAGELLFRHARQALKERGTVLPSDQVVLTQAALGDQGGLIGAALWAKQYLER